MLCNSCQKSPPIHHRHSIREGDDGRLEWELRAPSDARVLWKAVMGRDGHGSRLLSGEAPCVPGVRRNTSRTFHRAKDSWPTEMNLVRGPVPTLGRLQRIESRREGNSIRLSQSHLQILLLELRRALLRCESNI